MMVRREAARFFPQKNSKIGELDRGLVETSHEKGAALAGGGGLWSGLRAANLSTYPVRRALP